MPVFFPKKIIENILKRLNDNQFNDILEAFILIDQNLKDLLIEAMNSEIKAKEFYLNASSKAQSNAGKNFFKELADFEQNHFEKVKEIIEEYTKDEKITCSEPCQEILNVKSEVEGEVEPNKNEIIEILDLAIKSEKEAHDRYQRIANMINDSEGKKIFGILANEEKNHQQILEHEIYHISNKGVIIWD